MQTSKLVQENVILITIDCLRYDNFYSKYTPRLSSFFESGLHFHHMYSNGPWTPPSFNSIFTSTLPFDSGNYIPLPDNKRTIAENLKENDYKTCAINSNIYITKYFNYHRGFMDYFERSSNAKWKKRIAQLFDNLLKLLPKRAHNIVTRIRRKTNRSYLNKNNVHITADEIVETGINWLRKNGNKPFFLWMHFVDIHCPFLPPRRYNQLVNPQLKRNEINKLNIKYRDISKILKAAGKFIKQDEVRKIVDLYNAGLLFLDDELGKFFLFLKNNKLLDKTNVIFTADHGELFLEHNSLEHPALFYDELLHVPFLMYLPSIEEKRDVNNHLGLIDFSPTILDMLDLSPDPAFKGKSFKNVMENQETGVNHDVISQSYIKQNGDKIMTYKPGLFRILSIRTPKWKYIFDEAKNSEELYDITRDTRELKNMAKGSKVIDLFKLKRRNILDGKYDVKSIEKTKLSQAIGKIQLSMKKKF